MSERSNHKFQFSADAIAKAAKAEAEYHEARAGYWQERYEKAAEIVKATVSAKVTESLVTGGKQLHVSVDYGDPAAWEAANEAYSKVQSHRTAADRYRTDERVYGTQLIRTYELDSDDIHHFRLGGQARDE
jgi:hypothetical protein